MVLNLLKTISYYTFVLIGQIILCFLVFHVFYPTFKTNTPYSISTTLDNFVKVCSDISPVIIKKADKNQDINSGYSIGTHTIIFKLPRFGKSKYFNMETGIIIFDAIFYTLTLFFATLFVSIIFLFTH